MLYRENIIIGSFVLFFSAVFGVVFFSRFLPNINRIPLMTIQDTKTEPTTQPPIQVKHPHSLSPIASNQWYSNMYKSFPTKPLYALPLVYQLTARGLSFSYPDVKATEKTIFAPFIEDITVGLSEDGGKPTIESIGDWNIQATMQTKNKKELTFTLAHGIPYTTILIKGNEATITIPQGFTINNHNTDTISSKTFSSDAYVVTTNNHDYLLAFPKQVKNTVTKKEITIEDPQSIFVGLLDKRSHYDLFKEIADVQIEETFATTSIKNDDVITDYQIVTNGKLPLITLFPHQYDFLTDRPDILGSYDTIRGTLELIRANTFTTVLPLTRPDETFPKLSQSKKDVIDQLKKDIAETIKKGPPDSKDYYQGTWFGKVTNLLLLTDTFGLHDEQRELLSYVEPIFTKSLTYFSYDKATTSLLATRPEFGNEKLNDHHFHYGYYIRTAAVLSKYQPDLLDRYKPMIQEMVSDIATTERNAEKYPYLRNFDMYEGHSWADGFADFAEGNNQESSSEAINAWYAVYLWSKVTKDATLENYALSLYTTEITSTLYYWFDSTSIYGIPYAHRIASVVWGGKVDFATWFSKDPNMIYGIQLLPITPASLYLGDLTNFAKYADDFKASGGDATKEWGDLFTIWQSFYQPKEALAMQDKVTKSEGNTPRSLFLYMLSLHSQKR